jgi:integrase/recombinase XerD
MREEVVAFTVYLQQEKKASKNTVISYERDLRQLFQYLDEQGISDLSKVTKSCLNSYIVYLQKEGKASTSISRMLASVKAFFHYEFREGKIRKDPAELLKAPKVEKKPPVILTVKEVEDFLCQPGTRNAKEIRDKAMLELLYATGIRASELTGLKSEDVNMDLGYIHCNDGFHERMIPFGKAAGEAMKLYLDSARAELLHGRESEWLFVNCSGGQLSRQGFWKIVKYYGEKAGIKEDITPHSLRHSFAAHMLSGGADVQLVQTMLGNSDTSTTHAYRAYVRREMIRERYESAHPRK